MKKIAVVAVDLPRVVLLRGEKELPWFLETESGGERFETEEEANAALNAYLEDEGWYSA